MVAAAQSGAATFGSELRHLRNSAFLISDFKSEIYIFACAFAFPAQPLLNATRQPV
jgi:hypothetical protein